jgi:hypothetical protein
LTDFCTGGQISKRAVSSPDLLLLQARRRQSMAVNRHFSTRGSYAVGCRDLYCFLSKIEIILYCFTAVYSGTHFFLCAFSKSDHKITDNLRLRLRRKFSFSHFSENLFCLFFAKIYEYDENFCETKNYAETDRVRWFSRKWKRRWDDFVKFYFWPNEISQFCNCGKDTFVPNPIWDPHILIYLRKYERGNGYTGFWEIKLENFRKKLTSFFITAIRMVGFNDLWKSTFFYVYYCCPTYIHINL